jgi:hypothetical protein
MKLEVSLGEAIDKLNILELKMKKISNKEKCIEIQKEIDELNECQFFKSKYQFFYNLLSFVNEYIWDTTDIVKKTDITDSTFATLSNIIFEYNQKRFRIKNWFNVLETSNIKEQKSYDLTHVYITTDSIDTIYNKIPEINYLLLEYDIVYFINSDTLFIDTMKNLFKQPNLQYIADSNKTIIDLNNFIVTENKDHFEYPTVNYISGGLLGDFIHQLSVVNEIFINTGRKGNLYISTAVGDNFSFGIETAYNDTYPFIKPQIYINNYTIFNGEKIDVNLSQWRDSPLLFKTDWCNIFKQCYNIEWCKHPWLVIPKNNIWENKVIINYTLTRPIQNLNFQELYLKYGKNLIFMGFNTDGYEDLKRNNIFIEYYRPNSLYEFAVAINSCKLFIGGLSSPLTFAFACHKQSIIGYEHNNMDNIHFIGLPFPFLGPK